MENECPITEFKITKVWDNENQLEVSENDFKLLFKITDQGIFELMAFDMTYKNYFVFIDVFNTAIWSKTEDYIVDVSFRDIDPKFVISELS
jgi:nucleoside-specific outer membrane channel protein Tsx